MTGPEQQGQQTADGQNFVSRRPDVLRTPEREWEPRFSVLLISGKGSSGNTSSANNLARLYGIPPERVFHGGEIFRKYAKTDNGLGYIPRPRSLDESVDSEIIDLITTATIETPIIIEAKLAGALNRHLEQIAQEAGVELSEARFSVLKWANQTKRTEIARNKKNTQRLSKQEIQRQSADRDARDYEQWVGTHPWLSEYTNILDKNARDNNGEPIYDLVVDASRNSGEEADTIHIHETLRLRGLVTERQRPIGNNN